MIGFPENRSIVIKDPYINAPQNVSIYTKIDNKKYFPLFFQDGKHLGP